MTRIAFDPTGGSGGSDGLGGEGGGIGSEPAGSPAGGSLVARSTADGRPLPVFHGTRKIQSILVEKYAPEQVTPPAWAQSTNYAKGQYVVSTWTDGDTPASSVYLAMDYGNSGTIAGGASPGTAIGRGADTAPGNATVTWHYVQDLPFLVWRCNFLLAICEGPVNGKTLGKLWWDKELLGWNDTTHPDKWLLLKTGPDGGGQTVGAAFDSMGYQHTALMEPVDANGTYTGTQQEIPAVAPELTNANLLFGVATDDCNPADILIDLWSHSRRGAGLDASKLDASVGGSGTASFRTWCDAAGCYFSTLFDTQRTVLDILHEILSATLCDAVWSGGKLKIVPLSDETITSPVHGATHYVSPNAVAYDLGDGDIVGPVRIKIREDVDSYNSAPVQYVDRGMLYATTQVEDHDQTDVEVRGALKRGGVVALSFAFPDGTWPQSLSRVLVQRSLGIQNVYTFTTLRKYVLLERTDIVTLTDSQAGLDHVPVRITATREENGGRITFTAEDYPEGVSAVSGYTPATSDGYQANEKGTKANLLSGGITADRMTPQDPTKLKLGSTLLKDTHFARSWLASCSVNFSAGGGTITVSRSFNVNAVQFGGSASALQIILNTPPAGMADMVAWIDSNCPSTGGATNEYQLRRANPGSAGAAYNGATTYAGGDVVTYGGKRYISLQAANHGHQPDLSPTWWSTWFIEAYLVDGVGNNVAWNVNLDIDVVLLFAVTSGYSL